MDQNSKISKGEEKIIYILRNSNIDFIREKTFLDLKKGKYRFDFYLPLYNICIECDGPQHFEQINFFQKNRKDFLSAQERDRRKNSYCLAHNIKLYRIPYFDINNINTFNDLVKEKYLVRYKWHNDILQKRYKL